MFTKQLRVHDMTSGNEYKHIIAYSIPVFIGSFFQLLYNIVDTIIVGKFINTNALAAVGSTGLIITVLVYFFMGFSVGAGVIVGQSFGAKDVKSLRDAVRTSVAVAFIFCVVESFLGYFTAEPILRAIHTPKEVFSDALIYLRVYCIGFSGVILFIISSEILRAVGNTIIPVFFLILSSLLNVVLDLVFVLVFNGGVAAVAWATVISQLVSAIMIIGVLTKTREIYRLEWRKLRINNSQAKIMFKIGMPAGIQSIITGLANLIAQSFVNKLGSSCMAGWSCFNKLLNIAMLPTGAFSCALSSYISQNFGAKKINRVIEGVKKANILGVGCCTVICVLMFLFAEPLTAMYTTDTQVIAYGATFVRWMILFIIYYSVGNNLVSAMIATGDSVKPTAIKLVSYVGLRLLCLFAGCLLISNSPVTISLAFSASWVVGTTALYVYYKRIWMKRILLNI